MNNKILIAVAIPFVLLCLLIARAEYHVKTGEQWNVNITGYDPRDLLRGHYLRFNLAYDWETTAHKCDSGAACCLCLTSTDSQIPKVNKVSCDVAKTQCDAFIAPEYERSLHRFYIAETDGKRAEDLLSEARANKNAFISLSINKKGEPIIRDLLIGDRPIGNILRETAAENNMHK
ncbi:GDYXXLXY domain-containing protein [Colwellia sp. MB3u-70]|uniref:GDYXXLXY domain-containing protein n=1 Tax=unclassified Colwellia TaxID=196834 RepID=UPI0015F483C4|nr:MULTISPECIES: GDYXXLXY domain-containing protein [unclassified Colwellia]MBA6291479.1 GDYXXLXY domain-containing protein [Colwellia sp. MB3u-8]MBA6305987.1 GDYXXLXY domain-containing protein [Colwellia sp. MB3u-70]